MCSRKGFILTPVKIKNIMKRTYVMWKNKCEKENDGWKKGKKEKYMMLEGLDKICREKIRGRQWLTKRNKSKTCNYHERITIMERC